MSRLLSLTSKAALFLSIPVLSFWLANLNLKAMAVCTGKFTCCTPGNYICSDSSGNACDPLIFTDCTCTCNIDRTAFCSSVPSCTNNCLATEEIVVDTCADVPPTTTTAPGSPTPVPPTATPRPPTPTTPPGQPTNTPAPSVTPTGAPTCDWSACGPGDADLECLPDGCPVGEMICRATGCPPPPPVCTSSDPASPSIVFPRNEFIQAASVQLNWDPLNPPMSRWGDSCGAPNRRYRVYVSKNSSPPYSNPECDVSSNRTECTFAGDLTEDKWYWRVRAEVSDDNGWHTASSPIYWFRLIANEMFFQVTGGSVHANVSGLSNSQDAIRSKIYSVATNQNFIRNMNGYHGLLSFASGGFDFNPAGKISENPPPRYRARTSYQGSVYDYYSLSSRLDNIIDLNLPEPYPTLNWSQLSSSGNYRQDSDLYINSSQMVTFKKLVILVSGNLYITGASTKINLATQSGSEALLFIVRGNIYVDSSVGGGTPAAPDLEGVYVSSGVFETQSAGLNQDIPLVVRGAVIAHGGVALGRDLPNADERVTPGELFIQRPDILVSLPSQWSRKATIWTEVAP